MTKILVILFALVITGCANHPKHKNDAQFHAVTISFVGAQNDLMPGVRTPQITTDIRGDQRIAKLPLTYAVLCNTAKTECRHAVVGTEVVARYTFDSSGRLHISGILRSQMGRSVHFDSRIFSETISVPDSVPLIASLSEENTIDAYLEDGEVLTLRGLAGTKVTISWK